MQACNKLHHHHIAKKKEKKKSEKNDLRCRSRHIIAPSTIDNFSFSFSFYKQWHERECVEKKQTVSFDWVLNTLAMWNCEICVFYVYVITKIESKAVEKSYLTSDQPKLRQRIKESTYVARHGEGCWISWSEL